VNGLQGLIAAPAMSHGCGCIGPQRGEPLCPCKMGALGVTIINGRYVQPARDLGPAPGYWCEPLADLVKGQQR
jgi:hypothetical protein